MAYLRTMHWLVLCLLLACAACSSGGDNGSDESPVSDDDDSTLLPDDDTGDDTSDDTTTNGEVRTLYMKNGDGYGYARCVRAIYNFAIIASNTGWKIGGLGT